jgi:hypothetical protein
MHRVGIPITSVTYSPCFLNTVLRPPVAAPVEYTLIPSLRYVASLVD